MANVSKSLGSLARSAGLLTAGTILGRAFGLIGETLIARLLAPAVYGDLALAYTIVTVVGSFSLFGVHEGLTRLGSADQDPRARLNLVVATATTAAFGGIISMGLIVLFADPIADVLSQPAAAQYLLILSPYLVLYPLSLVVISMLRVQRRSATTVLTRAIAARIVPLAFLGLGLLAGVGPLVAGVYWLSVPLVIVLLGGGLALTQMETEALEIPSREQFRTLWSFSWPIAASSVMFILLAQLDVLMIGYFLSSSDVGHYRAIQPLRQVATIFVGSFGFLFLPLATVAYQDGDLDEINALFGSVTKWVVLLTLPLILTFVFRSRGIVVFLFGRPYIEGAVPLAILAGGLFFRTVSGPNGDLVKAINRPDVEARASVGGVLVNVVLNWVLIQRFGIAGAAVATVTSYAVYNGIELAIIYRETGVTPFSAAIGKTVAASTALLWLVSLVLPSSGILALAGFGVVASVVCVVCVIVTRSIEEPDMMLLDRVEGRVGSSLPRVRRVLTWAT